MSGRIEALWIKRARRGPMDAVDEIELLAGRGIVGNTDQGGKRQVTLIASERWSELMDELNADIDPSMRRANVLLSGIDLDSSRGKTVQIGDVQLRIYGETRPCERMEEALPGLEEAMKSRWGGGAFAEIIEGGTLKLGDAVVLSD